MFGPWATTSAASYGTAYSPGFRPTSESTSRARARPFDILTPGVAGGPSSSGEAVAAAATAAIGLISSMRRGLGTQQIVRFAPYVILRAEFSIVG